MEREGKREVEGKATIKLREGDEKSEKKLVKNVEQEAGWKGRRTPLAAPLSLAIPTTTPQDKRRSRNVRHHGNSEGGEGVAETPSPTYLQRKEAINNHPRVWTSIQHHKHFLEVFAKVADVSCLLLTKANF